MAEPGKPVAGGLAALLATLAVLVAVPAAAQPAREPLEQASEQLPPDLLLDVGVQVLDPGLPPPGEPLPDGVFADLRKAESRYIAVHLATTLQASGQWGAVRVIPAPTDAVDVVIQGEILESTGAELALRITVEDARGERWSRDKFRAEADAGAYDEDAPAGASEPFQDLYNRIANRLLAERRTLGDDEVREIRAVAGLHFAAEIAPGVFGDYLRTDRRGRLEVARLPADDDPMFQRCLAVRDRDYLLVDTLNEHYARLYARMSEPYQGWRRFAYQEQQALEEVRRKARMQKFLGALAIAAGIFVEDAPPGARDAAVIGGTLAVQAGIQTGAEAKIHREALDELAGSFDSEVEPMLVEVEGEVLLLQGSAETQYLEWRELLHEIYLDETGLAVDPNSGEVAPAEAPEGPAQ